jgi:hypothetical protein
MPGSVSTDGCEIARISAFSGIGWGFGRQHETAPLRRIVGFLRILARLELDSTFFTNIKIFSRM